VPSCAVIDKEIIEKRRDIKSAFIADDLGGEYTPIPNYCNAVCGKDTEMRYRIRDTGYEIQDSGYEIQDSGYEIQDSGYRIQDTGYKIEGR